MDFEIKTIITGEYEDSAFNFDLIELESFLKKRLLHKNYGSSVIKYFWGFELTKFDGQFAKFFSGDIQSWKTKNRFLVINTHNDWNKLAFQNEEKIFKNITEVFLQSIDRFYTMKRKPKDFDCNTFKKDVSIYLKEFSNKYKIN
jgi:hypothetical protein